MKTLIKSLICIIFIFLISKTTIVNAAIYDNADILTTAEELELINLIEIEEEKIGANILIYSTNSNRYIDNEIDEWFIGLNDLKYDGSIIYAINMQQRMTLIIAYDDLKFVNFSDDDEIVLNSASLINKSPYKSIEYFINNINKDIQSSKTIRTIISIAISAIIATIIMIIAVFNTGGKVTVNHKNYIEQNKSKIFNNKDIYLRTDIIKTRKSSSSSGGSGRSGRGGHGRF